MAEENLGPRRAWIKSRKEGRESQKKKKKTESKTCEKGSEEKRYDR